jgi:hypothetical protein
VVIRSEKADFRAGNVAKWYMPSMCEALLSIATTTKNKKRRRRKNERKKNQISQHQG